MKIPYRTFDEYIPVDIEKLRPKDSYANLIERRTHPIDDLVREYGDIPGDLLAQRCCPTCDSDRSDFELEKDHLELVRCSDCDLVYTNPIFDEAHYKKVYRSDEYQDLMGALGEESHQYRLERFGTERVEIMAEHLEVEGRTPRYLDVGCSTGFVVEAAANAGWEALGIDLNPSAVQFAQDRDLNVQEVALEEASFERASFDAISLFDVLEHLPDPARILDRVIELLRAGGILFVYVPNFNSASRILMGKEAHFIWPTHHLNYYTPRTISDLFEREGLSVELVVTEGLDIADYIWHQENRRGRDTESLKKIHDALQFFVNAGAYGKNLRIIGRKKQW